MSNLHKAIERFVNNAPDSAIMDLDRELKKPANVDAINKIGLQLMACVASRYQLLTNNYYDSEYDWINGCKSMRGD